MRSLYTPDPTSLFNCLLQWAHSLLVLLDHCAAPLRSFGASHIPRKDFLQPRQLPPQDHRDCMIFCNCRTLVPMAKFSAIPCRSIEAVPSGSVKPVASVYSATSPNLHHGARQIYDAPWAMVIGRYIWYILHISSLHESFHSDGLRRFHCIISQIWHTSNLPPCPISSIYTTETFLSVKSVSNTHSRTRH